MSDGVSFVRVLVCTFGLLGMGVAPLKYSHSPCLWLVFHQWTTEKEQELKLDMMWGGIKNVYSLLPKLKTEKLSGLQRPKAKMQQIMRSKRLYSNCYGCQQRRLSLKLILLKLLPHHVLPHHHLGLILLTIKKKKRFLKFYNNYRQYHFIIFFTENHH